ncbi:AP-4-A phosphorylase [Anaerohalosphaera lusitana]|uniref:AP-4-A phosphorylase n=1 Tax=Anaerohalosphaera lusitana TaxID=1936003 RepID=A0A1U9NIG6_9BACT|nr:HIT domain-containing protein [Anaerohalosphaera lusitana]AQT67615.1 AP-4-A phosphorylase [Anaerohalosphaera lusitana]
MERKNLWAPWRMKYIKGLTEEHECFICHHLQDKDNDRQNLVLWRGQHSVVLFNRFPYNNGHMLIAPNRHIPDMNAATDEELFEITKLTREIQNALSDTIHPHGFNVGLNFGRCAGAGLPGHMHAHIVPRWNGDTNFMAVCSDTDVISQDLIELYDLLKQISVEKGYPKL